MDISSFRGGDFLWIRIENDYFIPKAFFTLST